MRSLNPLVFALLSSAYGANAANCNTHQARTDTGLSGKQIADELLGVLDTASNDLCKGASTWNNAEPRTYQHNSLVFAISQKDPTHLVTDCKTPFIDIISQCISQAGYWGGTSSTLGLTYEIHNEAYLASGLSKAGPEIQARADTPKKPAAKKPAAKNPTNPKKPPPPVPAKPTSLKGKPAVPTKPASLKGKPPVPTKPSSLKGKPPVPTKPSSLKGKTLSKPTATSTSSIIGCKPRKTTPTKGKPKTPTNGKPKKALARSESPISRHVRDFSVWPRSARQLFRRVGTPPAQCQDDNAGEDKGCFTVKDEANKPVRFALPQGKTDFSGSLGKGAFGGVDKCIRKDGLEIAVKVWSSALDKDMPKKNFDFLRALEVNQNIVKAYGYGTAKGKPALAMELLTGGSVKSRIASGDWKGKANEAAFKDVARQIINGVSHMHSKNIAHRDIQEGNVAFEGNTPKFVDLDFACLNVDCQHDIPANGRAPPGKCLEVFWYLDCFANISIEALQTAKQVMDFFNKGKPLAVRFIDPYANDIWTTATMLVHMTTGVKFPKTDSRAFKAAWSELDRSKRIANLFKAFSKENFSYEFVELLADVFTKEESRIKANEFRDRFRDLPSIYC